MNRINKIEDCIINFIKRNSYETMLAISFIISLLIRFEFLTFQSDDYVNFLAKWFEIIRSKGGILALKEPIGDYNMPYIFIMALITYLPINQLIGIKMISIIFDYVMSYVAMLITYELFKNNKNKQLYGLIVFVIVSNLPTTILNSSMWGQCDSIYTSFALLAILYILKEKNVKSFIFLGVAFSFKIQTIFLLPIFILIYLSRRNFSIINFLIIPVMNFVLSLPAMLVGKPIKDCFLVYYNQATEYQNYLVMNFPNVYSLFFKTINENYNLIKSVEPNISYSGIFAVLLVFSIIAIIFIQKNIKLNKNIIIKMSLWCVMFSTFMLPRMHDRYLFMADILSIIYVMINPKKYYIPIIVNLVSLYTYIVYVYYMVAIPVYYIAIMFGIALILLTKEIIIDIKENQKKGEQ